MNGATDSLKVRPASRSDAKWVARLLEGLGYACDQGLVAERLARLERDPSADVLVAVNANRVVGAVVLYFVPVLHEPGPWCRMTALAVNEHERGRGVGRALVAAAEVAARTAGCGRIEATSANERRDAHRFYESLGYRRRSSHFLKLLGE